MGILGWAIAASLGWAIMAAIVALVADKFGFGSISQIAASIARILFGIFGIIAAILIVMFLLGSV